MESSEKTIIFGIRRCVSLAELCGSGRNFWINLAENFGQELATLRLTLLTVGME
jgi:hypothetical protein